MGISFLTFHPLKYFTRPELLLVSLLWLSHLHQHCLWCRDVPHCPVAFSPQFGSCFLPLFAAFSIIIVRIITAAQPKAIPAPGVFYKDSTSLLKANQVVGRVPYRSRCQRGWAKQVERHSSVLLVLVYVFEYNFMSFVCNFVHIYHPAICLLRYPSDGCKN